VFTSEVLLEEVAGGVVFGVVAVVGVDLVLGVVVEVLLLVS
jgi:hypothetical protein